MTVLLVEDDAVVRLTLADFFEAAGLEFLEVGTAEDAMAILDNPAQPISVLVTDLDLGSGDNGLALAAKVRQRRPGLRVIYETGSAEMLAGRTLAGWEQVFYKPFSPSALTATVSALSGSRPLRNYPGRQRHS
ncbi:response regulator [Belnapia rosea]|uniref:Response regulator receiver domain-containing protein n=1 Tax=Belnapia rosea TaxID=938405 RepID=A0A1G7DEC6_9PROT|nr:response regulator [Belnapia rosea]SDE49948.1 Response regulator receiver domain-containing protein [Belnapia rosea]